MTLQNFSNFSCPYCWQINTIDIDVSAGENQKLLTDCEVCCRPVVVNIALHDREVDNIDAVRENE